METDRFATDMQIVTAEFFITNDSNPLENATVFGFPNNQIQSFVEIRTQNPINYINQFRPTTEIARFEYRILKMHESDCIGKKHFRFSPVFVKQGQLHYVSSP